MSGNRLFLLLFFYRFLLVGAFRIFCLHKRVNQQSEAEQNQRDAEFLSVVEHMAHLGRDLHLFEELDDETCDKDDRERDAGCTAGGHFALGEFEIIGDKSNEQQQVNHGFIKLCGVTQRAGNARAAHGEIERPGYCGDTAHNLVVHQVPTPHKRRRNGHRNGQTVQ